MTGYHIGIKIVTHRFCQNYRVQEYSRLGNFGLTQIFVCSVKHQVGDIEAQYLVGLIEHLFGYGVIFVEVFSHTYKLRPLSGKYKCFHFLLF